jgi:hypothetical protein
MMGANRSRSLRIWLRRQKAEIRRQAPNPEAAIDALLRQYPRPGAERRPPRDGGRSSDRSAELER